MSRWEDVRDELIDELRYDDSIWTWTWDTECGMNWWLVGFSKFNI